MIEAPDTSSQYTYADLPEDTKARLRPLGRVVMAAIPNATFDVCPAPVQTDRGSADTNWQYVDLRGTLGNPVRAGEDAIATSRIRITDDFTLDYLRLVFPPIPTTDVPLTLARLGTFQQSIFDRQRDSACTPVLSINECPAGLYPICTLWPPENEPCAADTLTVNIDTEGVTVPPMPEMDDQSTTGERLSVAETTAVVDDILTYYQDLTGTEFAARTE